MEQLVFALIQGYLTQRPRSLAGPALAVLAGFFAFAAVAFLMAAGLGWLEQRYDHPVALALMAGAVVVLALVCYTSARVIRSYYRSKSANYYKTVKKNITAMIETLVTELEEPIQEHPKSATALAGLAGFIASEKFLHSSNSRSENLH